MDSKEKIEWHNEKRRLSELIKYEKNPRVISKEAAAQLKKSITKIGYVETIAINTDNTIVAGHQRLDALKKINKKDIEIDVRVPERELTEKEFKDYLIDSNKAVGDWEYTILSELFTVEELKEKGFDPDDFDFDEIEVLETEGDDDIPEKPDDPKTALGDLYELGNHRLLCGDSTDERNRRIVVNDNNLGCVFSDPPYELDADSVNLAVSCCNDIIMLCTFKQALNLCEMFYFHFDFVFIANMPKSFMNKKQPYYLHQTGIYLTVDGNTSFHCDNAKNVRSEKGYWSTVIDAPRDISKHGHGKSVEGIIHVLSGWNKKIIYDPFLGSGSTLIACEKMKKTCIGMELSPHYCDVIVERYKTFCEKNGKTPTIKRNGKQCNDF